MDERMEKRLEVMENEIREQLAEIVVSFFLFSRVAWLIYGLVLGVAIEHYFGLPEWFFR